MTEGTPTVSNGKVIINRSGTEGFFPSSPFPGHHIIGVLELVLIDLIDNLDPLYKEEWRMPPIKGYVPQQARIGEL
jgi:hypothetical protein